MDWTDIIPGIITILALIIGISLALQKKRKGSPRMLEQLLHQLLDIGIRASLVEEEEEKSRLGLKRSFAKRSEGIIKVEGKRVDYINISSATSQYGVNYFLDFMVRNPGQSIAGMRKKTRMARKKSPPLWGKVVDIEWRGDFFLSQQLNLDYRLKDILLQADSKQFKGSLEIFPEPAREYARIRAPYFLPSLDLFDGMDIIAGYIKSG
jgi:hypothetical protein